MVNLTAARQFSNPLIQMDNTFHEVRMSFFNRLILPKLDDVPKIVWSPGFVRTTGTNFPNELDFFRHVIHYFLWCDVKDLNFRLPPYQSGTLTN